MAAPTSDDLAAIHVPVPDDDALVAWVEGEGGIAWRAGQPPLGLAWGDADAAPARPGLVAARRLPLSDLRQLATHPTVLGIVFDTIDEDRLLGLADLEDEVTRIVPGTAFATGWRLGATGTMAPSFLVDPAGFRDWCASFEDDLERAITIERRVQRVFESALVPIVRRAALDATGLQVALAVAGGWETPAVEPELARDLVAFGHAFRAALAGK